MNSDATEAALGLLGLSPLNATQSHPHPHPQPQHPHHHVAHAHGPSLTSPSVGIAVDHSSAPHIFHSALPPSIVPLKRKQPSPAAPLSPRDVLSTKPPHPLATSSTPPASSTAPLQRHPQPRPFTPSLSVPPKTPPTSQISLPSPSTSQHPLALSDVPPPDSDAISCICGFTYDDGFSIACDDCSRWCHAACFGIVQGGEVPEFWKCWVCDPAVEVDKERAVKIQKGRLKAMRMKASHGTNGAVPGSTLVNGIPGSSAVDDSVVKPNSRRKTSPGADRKSRRGSAVAAAIEGSGSSRKKRRASMLSPADPSSPSVSPLNPSSSTQPHASSSRISHPNGNGPATFDALPPTPITFPPDTYPNPSVYAQLLRVAKAWRGVTALNPPSPLTHIPPKTYNDAGYTRVDSQGYRDRYGYSMSPLDNTTPVILDENVGDVHVPRTVLRDDQPMSCFNPHSGLPPQHSLPSTTYTPAHFRPPSPKLFVSSEPSPFSHASIYPSPPISNYTSPAVPSSSHPRPYAKSPLTPSTNTNTSSNRNDTIPATTLLTPYTAAIIPSATYLADPLNGYAHLGMGKPQVRLVGGGWEVGLDARGVGGDPDLPDPGERGNAVNASKEGVEDGKAKWARCGCWPNAVVRPVICSGTKRGESKKRMRMRHKAECTRAAFDGSTFSMDDGPPRTVNGWSVPPPMSRMQDDSSDQDDAPSASDSDVDPTTLSFALFALRDLRADEEIVLGWEWDDGHAVHMLPALMESPGMFAPGHLHHLRAQFTSILHALSSTFTTCACGSSTRDCAVRVMESVVEGRWPWPGGEMTSEGSEDDSSDVDVTSGDCEGDIDVEGDDHLDFPSRNCGLGMNVDMDIEMNASIEVERQTRQVKKCKVRKRRKVDDVTPIDGERDEAASRPKPRYKKGVDLGPLVGVKRGFRTREKAPLNGGWGGVEVVPSSLEPFPEVRGEEGLHVNGKGKGKARVADDEDDADPSPSRLPPRMRKVWPPLGQPEPIQENLPDHSKRAESWRAHERWRSPPDTNAQSPISVSGSMESCKGIDKPGSSSGDGEDGADGQETEFDTETEADGADDTRQMPPPPMPASLDPTTVSSLAHAVRSLSPRGSVQWDKNSVVATFIPPRTPTPTPVSSGRSSQPPSHATATPVPPALSPAPSFPLTMQMQIQSYPPVPLQPRPPPLAASISPSATFSKLSLHSPDTSTSLHHSVLYSPSESISLPVASPSTERTSDFRAPSPPPHKPSKSLHVHSQNEPLVSLSAPVVTLNSPDNMRDTPVEAQYQRSYRSSPESRPEIHPPPNVDKKRPANGEPFRVRFASPEILGGLPGLRGRATSNSLEAVGAADGISTSSEMSGVLNTQEAPLSAHDAMNVDINGDEENQRENGSVSSHFEDSGSRNHDPLECSSLHVPDSPRAPVSSEILPPSVPVMPDDTTPENDLSPPASDANEGTSQVEPMSTDPNDPELAEPARELSAPPPPKVKMSLKDFALRKKKQREEEMAAKALHSPATPDGPGLPPSPNLGTQRDLASEYTDVVQGADLGSIVNSHDVKMNGVTHEDALDSSGAANVFDGGSGNDPDGVQDLGHTEEPAMAEDSMSSADIQAQSVIPAMKLPDTTTLSPPLATSPRVLGERNSVDQTHAQIGSKPPTTLMAKIEVIDAMLPSGPVGADESDNRTPDVVSFAPEPPPPPLTIKQTNETIPVDRTLPTSSILKSIALLTSASTSMPASVSTSTSTSASNSRSNSVGIPIPALNPNPPPYPHVPTSSSNIPPSRRPSHEDGEITSTPPKSFLPRSHTPPTQPRSFHAVHPPSPSFGPTSSPTIPVPRRPAPPLSRSPLSNAAGPPTIPSRPLPSGPRALRGSITQPSHISPYPSSRPPYAGSQYIPRGPSADRDRIDWDRSDRQWSVPRSRGRAGSNGWGR